MSHFLATSRAVQVEADRKVEERVQVLETGSGAFRSEWRIEGSSQRGGEYRKRLSRPSGKMAHAQRACPPSPECMKTLDDAVANQPPACMTE